MRHTTLILSLTLLLASCASVFTAPDQRETSYETVAPDGAILIEPNIRIELDGNAVVYRGSLTAPGLAALQRTGSRANVDTLVIESSGGEIVVGMDFGIWVSQSKLDVLVDRSCLSSCANYVFTAGQGKEILPGAVVAWHGSAKQPGLLEQLHRIVQQQIDAQQLSPRERERELERAKQENVRYLTEAIYKQDQFFSRLGIDEYVTRIGNDKYGVRGFFYLSVPDMASFGIQNVSAPGDYADMEPQALAQRVGFPVTLVRLE